MRVAARIARPGVLTYQTQAGPIRELVPESTLKDPEYLSSLVGKPVTLEHPGQLLTPDSVAEHRVGTILSPVEYVDGEGIVAPIQIENRSAIEAVQSGKNEVSPGYLTETDPTPGVDPKYGPYDRIQSRRYAGNHLALTDKSRMGPDVRLLLRNDSDGIEIEIEIPPSPPKQESPVKISPPVLAILATLKMDPSAFADDTAALAAINAKCQEAQAASAEMAASVDAMEAVPGAIEAVAEAGPEMPADACGPKMDSAVKGKRAANHTRAHQSLQAVVAERSRLDSHAKALGLKDTAALGNGELRKRIVLAANPNARKDGTPDYYRAAFDLIGARTDSATSADPYAAVSQALDPNHARQDGARKDADDDFQYPSQASRKSLLGPK